MSVKLTMISKIKRFNPVWANNILDYLTHEDNEYLYNDNASKLNIGNYNQCVVGEVWNWMDSYAIDHDKQCNDCHQLGNKLFDSAYAYEQKIFQDTLELLYSHVEFVHPELVPKAK